MRFSIKKWNGKDGKEAVFVVEDNKTEKQSLFTPGKVKDMAWVDDDLVTPNKDWQDFGNEQIADLDKVLF